MGTDVSAAVASSEGPWIVAASERPRFVLKIMHFNLYTDRTALPYYRRCQGLPLEDTPSQSRIRGGTDVPPLAI